MISWSATKSADFRDLCRRHVHDFHDLCPRQSPRTFMICVGGLCRKVGVMEFGLYCWLRNINRLSCTTPCPEKKLCKVVSVRTSSNSTNFLLLFGIHITRENLCEAPLFSTSPNSRQRLWPVIGLYAQLQMFQIATQLCNYDVSDCSHLYR